MHAVACLLKQWFRDLRQPVIPSKLYQDCLSASSDAKKVRKIVDQRLPELHRRVLKHFVGFLRHFTAEIATSGSGGAVEDVVASTTTSTPSTHMPLDVLCLVMAPLILRPPEDGVVGGGSSPVSGAAITQRLHKETQFMKTLILHLSVEEEETSEAASFGDATNKQHVDFDV